MAKEQTDLLQSLVNRLREIRREGGDRLSDLLADGPVRDRATAVSDKIEDLRRELTVRLRRIETARGGRPAGRTRTTTRARPAGRTRTARRTQTAGRGKPAATTLQDMTVHDLHKLATRRHVSGRSAMNKAELVDALSRT